MGDLKVNNAWNIVIPRYTQTLWNKIKMNSSLTCGLLHHKSEVDIALMPREINEQEVWLSASVAIQR